MPGELIPIALFLSIAAICIFRPLTRRVGDVLEQIYRDKKEDIPDPNTARIAGLLERLVDRMDRLEDRLEFAERMLESREREPMAGLGGARGGTSARRPSGAVR